MNFLENFISTFSELKNRLNEIDKLILSESTVNENVKISTKYVDGVITVEYTYPDENDGDHTVDVMSNSLKNIFNVIDVMKNLGINIKMDISYVFPKLQERGMKFSYDGNEMTSVIGDDVCIVYYNRDEDQIECDYKDCKAVEYNIEDDRENTNQVCVNEIDDTVSGNCDVMENTDSAEDNEKIDMKKIAFNLKSHIENLTKKEKEENEIYENWEKCEKKFSPVIALDMIKEKISEITESTELPECLNFYREDGEVSGFYMNLTDFYGVEDDDIKTIWKDEEDQTDLFCNLACENFGFTHVCCNPVRDKDDNIINIEFDFVF